MRAGAGAGRRERSLGSFKRVDGSRACGQKRQHGEQEGKTADIGIFRGMRAPIST